MSRWHNTHDALRRAAWELFVERGYDATSTVQVADRAGVSEMTLFRHFSTKEALLLTDPFDPLMASAVRSRSDHEGPLRALVEGIRQAWRTIGTDEAQALRDLLRLVARTPTLHGAIERNSVETSAALRSALVDRGAEPSEAAVAVAAVIAALSTALLDWAQSEQTSLDAAVAAALDVLGGS